VRGSTRKLMLIFLLRLLLCVLAAGIIGPLPLLLGSLAAPELAVALYFGGLLFTVPVLMGFGLPFALIHLFIAEPRWWSSIAIGGTISSMANLVLFGIVRSFSTPWDFAAAAVQAFSYGAAAGLGAWSVWMATGGGYLYKDKS